MEKVSMIGIDLAKHVFQLHGAAADGKVLFRRRVRREKLLAFLAAQPACDVVMEACGSAHYWAREIGGLGHRVRLIAPAYVKPFSSGRRTMRRMHHAGLWGPRTPQGSHCGSGAAADDALRGGQERRAAGFGDGLEARDLLVRQRTNLVNAVRAHLAEFGVIAPKGLCHVGRLAGLVEQDGALPEPVRRLCGELLGLITVFNERIGALDREVRERARADETARRLMTIKGVGPVTALALSVLAPPPETFKCGRDLAAWIGLTPPIRFGRQHSSGGVSRLGQTSRMGQRDLRRLLIIGASAVVRWARRPASADRLAPKGSWLAGMLERKPPMLVTVALANKTARIAWALMAKGGVYQAPAAAA